MRDVWRGGWPTGLLAVGGVALAVSGIVVLTQQPAAVTAHVGTLPATAPSSSPERDARGDVGSDVPASGGGGTTSARPGGGGTTSARSQARTPEPAPGGSASTAVVADDSFVPDWIRAPSIGLDAALVPISADGEGVLEPPPDPSVLGWWRGVQPGAGAGSVLVAGHLDSRRYGLGPLQRLVDLEVRDRATVTGGDGDVATYAVLAVRTYPKEALPSAQLFTTSGPERLVLVTCGGRYDAGGGGWDSNVVAVLERVSPPPA